MEGQAICGAGGTLTANSGTLQNLGEFYGNNATVDITTGTVSSAPTPFVMTGPGTLVMAGVNTYSAGTTINGGVLQLSAEDRHSC